MSNLMKSQNPLGNKTHQQCQRFLDYSIRSSTINTHSNNNAQDYRDASQDDHSTHHRICDCNINNAQDYWDASQDNHSIHHRICDCNIKLAMKSFIHATKEEWLDHRVKIGLYIITFAWLFLQQTSKSFYVRYKNDVIYNGRSSRMTRIGMKHVTKSDKARKFGRFMSLASKIYEA